MVPIKSRDHLGCIRELGVWGLFRPGVVSTEVGRATAAAQHYSEGIDTHRNCSCHMGRGHTIQVLCDNAAVVAILNKNSRKDSEIMHLIRCLAFITARFQFIITAAHIAGVKNMAADALSRNKLDVFRSIYPQADPAPSSIPAPLLDLLLLSKPDWTSWTWTELWNSIFNMA